MLAQRGKQCANIKTPMGQRLVLTGLLADALVMDRWPVKRINDKNKGYSSAKNMENTKFCIIYHI